MTRQERIERHDALYKLLTALPGADFGAVPECAETDPEVFFPEPGRVDLARRAIAICERCPVREACLEKALQNGELGIWGGTTETQRRKIRAQRRRAAQQGREAA
ncbi:WhiB family transcriptional regulator [Saccharopolyspora mangrovi]|uniref:Transcriptional regulator WhiB n=1 Tax=Saccharopolyspora mangrovi TaxID=3082379 RepID=A0ABU6A9A7_9PSEU|nr:WhiB family transcriptional regulator [Saccharopolyspora sp. S2-29]MEB3368068.1 WhiB family transcriptional regulator [Saccharopolyspora sp. S2-29]